MRVEELLRDEALRSIESAVRTAEARTSGEIVPLVVDRSDSYATIRGAWAAFAAFASGIAMLYTPLDVIPWLPVVQAAAFVLVYLGAGQRDVLRALVPAAIRDASTQRAACLAFVEQGLTNTRDRTGVLLFVSLLEHRVIVLADRGIDSRVEPGTWDGVVERIVSGIRERHAEVGLCEAIETCGRVLAERFPRGADDVNELEDRLRT